MPCSKKNVEYLEFVEQTGVKYIGRMANWAYFRKEKDKEYNFDMYSDNESKVKYLKRILIVPFIFAILNLLSGFTQIALYSHSKNAILAILNFSVAWLCGYASYKLYKKIKETLTDNITK